MDHRPWHRHYDNGVPPALDFENATVIDWMRRAASSHGARRALVFLNGRLTFREFEDQVERLATALAGLGVEPGSRVAIMTPNIPQFEIASYATMLLGAIAVPTNPLYTPPEIRHQWTDAGAEIAVVMDYIFDQRIRSIRDTLPIREYVIASIPEYLRFPLSLLAPLRLKRLEPPLVAKVAEERHVRPFRKLIDATVPRVPRVDLHLDDVATLLYTGGTTGVSKGAALTHGNLSSNVQQLRAWFPKAGDGEETILCALPLFHSFGYTVVMHFAMRIAATQIMIPNPRDIPAIIKAVVKHRITLFPAVPNHYAAINRFAAEHDVDLSSIKACNSGSAPLPVDTLETFERLTGAKISEGFGLTETSPVTHSNPLYSTRKVGSIGVPLPSTDCRIVGAEAGTRGLPAGEVGELIVKGPQVMRGYWNRSDATADMIRDGWLYTGDLARMDEDGFCFIEGRKKDMILCSGYNVYPDEIDRVLAAHPAVLEAATIGVSDAARGEHPLAFVVLRPGASATPEELDAYCRENLAAYKVPREWKFISELPKSSILKVLRRELREREMAGRSART